MSIKNLKSRALISGIILLCIISKVTAQDSIYVYPSFKEFQMTFSCNVKPSTLGLLYNYSIGNKTESFQRIECFFVESLANLTSIINPSYWSGDTSNTIKATINWCSDDSTQDIYPGYSNRNFSFTTLGLPYICNYYAIGHIEIPAFEDGDEPWSVIGNDIFKDSKIGKTIGAKDPTNPFVPIEFLDTLISYNNSSRDLNWITTQSTADKYSNYLTNAKLALQQNNISLARTNLQNILHDVDIDSSGAITSEVYALLRYNTEYLLSKLPQPPSGLAVKLINSTGTKLIGGSLQYYEGSWKDAVSNNDGTFTIPTTLKNVSLRMNYAYGSQTKSNVTVGADTVVFQTVNATVQLKNSLGGFIDQGTVQYYSGAWRDFGVTTSGVVTKELLPNNYSFRMSYSFASNDKQQNIGTDPTVVFQTVNVAVQLKNSLGNFIDAGTVQYYSGAWRDFGVTTNGAATKELLPNNYSFRMSYAFASNDKQQNVGTNPTVVFQTVNATVQLKNSLGNLIDAGTVQYYSGAWRDFGVTTNGAATKELLPNNYSFRMSYAFASNDKQQNVGTDPIVVFQTVNATVQLKNSLGNLIDAGTVQYYSGAWRNFGTTSNGIALLELLPNNYSFRITHAFISNDKAQNIGTNNIVEFRTVLCNVNVTDAQNLPVNNAVVSYYSGAWRSLGAAVNGTAVKELLPANLTFRAVSGTRQADKTQNILTNNIVEIKLP